MWFLFGRFRCALCDALHPKANLAGRSLHQRGFGVCRKCYEGWQQGGRLCTKCKSDVKGTQEVAFFPDRRALGHFDCGGIKVA